MSNVKELLRLYYPLAGYIFVAKKDENKGTLELIEEAIEEDGKIRRLWENPRKTTIFGTDAEYLERLIEMIKKHAEIFVWRRFGEPTSIDWHRFEFGYFINRDDLHSDLKDWFDLNEGFELKFDPCPEPYCIPAFTPYKCQVRGITARLIEYHQKGDYSKIVGYGWVVTFNVWEIKRCIMGFLEHLDWYYKELEKLQQEEDFEEEPEEE